MTTFRNWLGTPIPMDRLSLIAVMLACMCLGVAITYPAAVWR